MDTSETWMNNSPDPQVSKSKHDPWSPQVFFPVISHNGRLISYLLFVWLFVRFWFAMIRMINIILYLLKMIVYISSLVVITDLFFLCLGFRRRCSFFFNLLFVVHTHTFRQDY